MGFRRRGKWNLEPLEDVWGPSDDDDVEDEERVEDDGEREGGMAERKRLGPTAEEECCGEDDDDDGEDEEGVDQGADEGHLRPVYCDLEKADRDSLMAPGAGHGHWSPTPV